MRHKWLKCALRAMWMGNGHDGTSSSFVVNNVRLTTVLGLSGALSFQSPMAQSKI